MVITSEPNTAGFVTVISSMHPNFLHAGAPPYTAGALFIIFAPAPLPNWVRHWGQISFVVSLNNFFFFPRLRLLWQLWLHAVMDAISQNLPISSRSGYSLAWYLWSEWNCQLMTSAGCMKTPQGDFFFFLKIFYVNMNIWMLNEDTLPEFWIDDIIFHICTVSDICMLFWSFLALLPCIYSLHLYNYCRGGNEHVTAQCRDMLTMWHTV